MRFHEIRVGRLLQRDLVWQNTEIAVERLLGCLQHRFDEFLESDVGEIAVGLSADKAEVLTVAIAAVTQAQRSPALEYGGQSGAVLRLRRAGGRGGPAAARQTGSCLRCR